MILPQKGDSMKTIDNCLVCDSVDFEILHEATFEGGWEQAIPYFLTDRERAVHGRIARCQSCEFVFTSPQFEDDEYERIYAHVPSDDADANRRHARTKRFASLRKRIGRFYATGRYVDLGCGVGAFLDAMPEYQGIGFELQSGAEAGSKAGDPRIVIGDFPAYLKAHANTMAGRLDFVTAWDVLEHLPTIDCHLEAVARSLRKGGHLFATIPDVTSLAARLSGSNWNCLLLEHLWYFSPATFRKYVRRFGLRLVEVSSFLFPADMKTVVSRFSQTYGRRIPIPAWMAGMVVSLPIGIAFVVCVRDD